MLFVINIQNLYGIIPSLSYGVFKALGWDHASGDLLKEVRISFLSQTWKMNTNPNSLLIFRYFLSLISQGAFKKHYSIGIVGLKHPLKYIWKVNSTNMFFLKLTWKIFSCTFSLTGHIYKNQKDTKWEDCITMLSIDSTLKYGRLCRLPW